ncbi:atrial natriuretic peptide receptor 3-like [Centruroides sculpturatus]|uniref:atrial natriuretic peptide receptor 3-like n=1 Tax=Centruroides sculpturatus TaxID=218467 RepID=UPI000C6C8BB3|nr:atrial natriuretic peptide receptor 3-like [Centruroides sculpturatus]
MRWYLYLILYSISKINQCFMEDGKRSIKMALLAPGDITYPFSIQKILPSILYAVRTLEKQGHEGILNDRKIEVLHRDTQCSSTYGPLAAFDLYNGASADVFLGPLCPYVLAPVARYSTVWDVPLLTSAGENDNFDFKEPHYRLLTRMNGSYSQIGQIFLQVLQKFNWTVAALLFHNYQDRQKGHSNCYFTLGAVFTSLGRNAYHHGFDETDPDIDYYGLLNAVSKNARSKFIYIKFINKFIIYFKFKLPPRINFSYFYIINNVIR